MCRSGLYRFILYMVLLMSAVFITGCPNVTLVYPERINYNNFTIPQKWNNRNITLIEVYGETENSKPSKEPLWQIKATRQVSADKFLLKAGSIPYGFEQTLPPLPDTFEPVDGKKYFITVKLEPADEDMFFVLKPWIASSVTRIGPDEEDDQLFIHQNSKMEFPKYVGLFERATINRYDSIGNDISIAYFRPPIRGIAELTVYIYPCTDYHNDLIKDFEACKQAIEEYYRDEKTISEGEIRITQDGNTYTGLGITYSFNKQATNMVYPVYSKLFLFRHGRWYIKYRATYLREMDEYVGDEIRQFMNELKWPQLP